MENLTSDDVLQGLQNRDILLVDVREPHEFSEVRIKGAFNFPLSTFDPSALPVDDDRKIVLQCGTGKRSGMALQQCASAGVKVSAHLDGGIKAWRSTGKPTIMVDPSTGQLREA